MDRDGTGLQQGGLVGEIGRAVRRKPVPGVQQQAPARPLGCLRGGEPGAFDGLDDAVAVHALERLRHRLHGDGRPVGDHGVDHRLDEHRRDQRTGPVVDQHRAVAARRVRAIEVADPGRDRGLTCRPAGDDLAAGRQPAGRGKAGDAIGRHDEDHAFDPARRRDRRHRPGEQRTAADEGRELVDPAHPARRPGGHDHGVGPLAPARCRRSRHRPSRPRAIVSRDAAGRRSSGRRPSGARASR